jgi:hypothetical protein
MERARCRAGLRRCDRGVCGDKCTELCCARRGDGLRLRAPVATDLPSGAGNVELRVAHKGSADAVDVRLRSMRADCALGSSATSAVELSLWCSTLPRCSVKSSEPAGISAPCGPLCNLAAGASASFGAGTRLLCLLLSLEGETVMSRLPVIVLTNCLLLRVGLFCLTCPFRSRRHAPQQHAGRSSSSVTAAASTRAAAAPQQTPTMAGVESRAAPAGRGGGAPMGARQNLPCRENSGSQHSHAAPW